MAKKIKRTMITLTVEEKQKKVRRCSVGCKLQEYCLRYFESETAPIIDPIKDLNGDCYYFWRK